MSLSEIETSNIVSVETPILSQDFSSSLDSLDSTSSAKLESSIKEETTLDSIINCESVISEEKIDNSQQDFLISKINELKELKSYSCKSVYLKAPNSEPTPITFIDIDNGLAHLNYMYEADISIGDLYIQSDDNKVHIYSYIENLGKYLHKVYEDNNSYSNYCNYINYIFEVGQIDSRIDDIYFVDNKYILDDLILISENSNIPSTTVSFQMEFLDNEFIIQQSINNEYADVVVEIRFYNFNKTRVVLPDDILIIYTPNLMGVSFDDHKIYSMEIDHFRLEISSSQVVEEFIAQQSGRNYRSILQRNGNFLCFGASNEYETGNESKEICVDASFYNKLEINSNLRVIVVSKVENEEPYFIYYGYESKHLNVLGDYRSPISSFNILKDDFGAESYESTYSSKGNDGYCKSIEHQDNANFDSIFKKIQIPANKKVTISVYFYYEGNDEDCCGAFPQALETVDQIENYFEVSIRAI